MQYIFLFYSIKFVISFISFLFGKLMLYICYSRLSSFGVVGMRVSLWMWQPYWARYRVERIGGCEIGEFSDIHVID